MPASPARESDGKDTAKNINISHLRIKFLWWSEFFLLSLFEDLKKYKIERYYEKVFVLDFGSYDVDICGLSE